MTSYINSRIRRNRFSITRQKALLALFSILALCCFSSAAELKVQFRGVSENTVIEGETVTIELSLATADKLSNYPDFSVLNDDFYLGTQQTGFSSTYINGKFTARQSISLNLTPKRTGQIQIPSFTWSGFTSEPFKLTVVPLDSTTKQERSELAFMEYEISPKSGYVNSAIYVDRKFYYQVGVQLSSFMTVFPDLDDAIEVSILEATSSVVQRDGRTYNLLSDRYAIFPEKSGQVVIPSQRILLSAYPSNSRRRQLLNFHTEEQYIEVLSIPAEYPTDVPWFPSKDVSVTREFDQTDLTNIKLGDALKWNVKIMAVGAYSESFPEFQLNVPEQFKIFTDLPDRQNVLCEKQLCGILTLTTTLIPSESGILSLPEQKFVWWDIEKNQLQEAVLPSETFRVYPDPSSVDSAASQTGGDFLNNVNSTDSTGSANSEPSLIRTPFRLEDLPPWLIAIGLVLIFVLVLSITTLIGKSETLSKATAARSKSKLERHLLPRLKGQPPAEMKKKILNWLQDLYSINRVEAIRMLENDSDGKRILDALNRSIYNTNEEDIVIDADELKRVLRSLRPALRPKENFTVPGFDST